MSQRTERVQKVARQVLADAIQTLKDPRVGFVTVTAVRVSPDLRHARVLVSVLGDDEARKASLAGLKSATPVLRAELGRQMRMKYLPDLAFELDEGSDRAERIEELLHRIHEDEGRPRPSSSAEGDTMRYGNEDWDEVVRLLKEPGEVALACHVNPDGDALGSLLAVSMGLRKLGARTYPSWGTTPVEMPPAYAFLPGADTLIQPEEVPETPVFVALDCGAADRLGDLEDRARAADVLINVDHHPGNDDFGTHNVVVTSASSTAELAAHLLSDAGVDLDRDIATALYTGIVTDTGRFQYSNSTPDTLRLAADLLEHGVSAPEIAIEVFESAPYGFLKLTGRVLERAVLFEDERFIYSWVDRSDLAEAGVAMDETEKLIDVIRATNVAVVAAIFKEQPNGEYRVSLRSKGPVSVGAIARAQGGGGHELAAGFTAPDVHDTARAIREELATH